MPRMTDSVKECVRRAVCMAWELTSERPRPRQPGPAIGRLTADRPQLRGHVAEPDEAVAAPVSDGNRPPEATRARGPACRESLAPARLQHFAERVRAGREI